jgi:threonine/homoserine/homoserine lactone efflux protein
MNGIIIGLSIAAPVGPIGLLCIRRTLNQGRLHGFVSGLGAASADSCYGIVAALGLTVVARFLTDQATWLNLAGSIVLFYLAYSTSKVSVINDPARTKPSNEGYLNAYGSTLLLTLTNPMTILSFAGIFAGMNIDQGSGSSLWLVLGVFIGSALWWMLLCLIVGLLKRMIGQKTLRTINLASAFILAAFGIYSLYQFGVRIGG